MKAAEDPSNETEKSNVAPESMKSAEPQWNPPETAPRDGRPVWLKLDNGKVVEAFWRTSRAYNREAMRWGPTGYFAPVIGPTIKLEGEIAGWYREDKHLPPKDAA
jgi:hypothetical protein